MRALALGSALLALVTAGLAAPARAQEGPPPAPAATPEPAAIPLSSLVQEAESAERFAAGVAPEGAEDAEITAIEHALRELTPALDEGQVRLEALSRARPSRDTIDAETRAWHIIRDQLVDWQRAPTQRLVALEGELDELARRQALWQRTREAAQAEQAPSEVLRRIDAVRSALRDAERRAKSAQRALVALQARIARRDTEAQSALDALAAAAQSLQTSLLVRDSAPIWRALSGAENAAEQAAARIEGNIAAARRYGSIAAPRMILQLAIFAAALLLTLHLRSRTEHLQRDSRLAANAIVFERAYSSATLIAISLTPALHPQAPLLVLGAARLALIAPVLRLLPALVDPALRPAIWMLALLAAVDAVRGPLGSVPPLERAVFTAELAAASAALVWMMRPARLALVQDPASIPRQLRFAQRLALALLLGALAASVLGWSNLAHLVGDGTLRSGYAAVVAYGGARVLRTGLRATVRSDAAGQLRFLREHGERVIARGARAVNVVGLSTWAALTLLAFGLLDDFEALVRAIWTTEIGYGSLSLTLGDVLTFVLTIWGASLIARLARIVLEGDVLARFEAQRGVSYAVARTAQYVLLLLGFFAAAAAAGIDMNRFAVLAGAFGVGIGFGLQNIVNNFVSGLILLYERPIQVGDSIEVGGTSGEVWRIGVRSCTVRTGEGAEVIVPNATLISERVVNWTLSDRSRRVDLAVGVAYGSDPRRVQELLVGCARENPGVLAHPEPIAALQAFGESALTFDLRFWAYIDRVPSVRSEVALAVHDALAAAGIERPFPQRDLHLRSVAAGAARALSHGGDEPLGS